MSPPLQILYLPILPPIYVSNETPAVKYLLSHYFIIAHCGAEHVAIFTVMVLY